MERRNILIVALLVAFALSTQLLLWLFRIDDAPPAFVGPPRSNYTLHDFELHALDDTGRLSFTVDAPTLARRNDDGSLWVDTPSFVLVANDGTEWKGESEAAWVSKDGTKMLLAGAVELHRDETPKATAARIESRDVTAWPKDKKLESAAPTRITQPGSILRGVGMKSDLNTHELELLADVHASFTSQKNKH